MRKYKNFFDDLPDIQDNRSKEDVLSRLKQDNRMQNLNRSKQKQFGKTNENLCQPLLLSRYSLF